MSKRRPGTELNHDNWEEEDEVEEKGEFRMASDAELSKRTIKTARRRNPNGSGSTVAATTSVFGGFAGFAPVAQPAKTETSAPSSIFAFLSKDKDQAPPTNNNDTDKSKLSSDKASPTYEKRLMALNISLCEWIKQHVDKDPVCILTPIFKDYEKHLDEIKKQTDDTNSNKLETRSESTTAISATGFKGFSFGSAAPVSEPAPAKISFGSSQVPSGGSLFSLNKPANSPLGQTTTGFSFGAVKSVAPETTNSASTAADGEGDADEDEPPKVEFTPVVESDSVFTKRCKVFFKINDNFQERGIGTIFVKPVKDSAKHQMIVRADTSLGNILVNVVLAKGMPVKKMGTNNVMMVCIPNTDFDKPVSVLLKVKAATDADEVVSKLQEFGAL